MNTDLTFIIIDDGELDRFLTRKFLELTYKDASIIRAFQNAQHALDIIRMNTIYSQLVWLSNNNFA